MVLMRDHVRKWKEVKEGKRMKGKDWEERVRKRGGAGKRGMVGRREERRKWQFWSFRSYVI